MFLLSYLNNLKKSWKDFILNESKKQYFIILSDFLKKQYKNTIVYPCNQNIFKAFSFFEVNETNLVILGQDPYFLKDMANGLAFSTNLNIIPKSLKNIFLELNYDFKIQRTNSDLSDIASQNVLLLNTILTVEKNKPLSHKKIGWEIFSKNLITFLSSRNKNIIYLLMGNNASYYSKFILDSYAIIKTSHPSPLSYSKSLKKSKTFLKINEMLNKQNKKKINW